MDDDCTERSTIDDACWAALDPAAGIHDPVERLVVLQGGTDEVASAQRRLETATVAALAEALLDLSVERRTLQMGVGDDIVGMVRQSWSERPSAHGPHGSGDEPG